MRRFAVVRALLVAGTILGFAGGFASLGHRGHCRSHRERPPAAAPANPPSSDIEH